MEEGPDREEFRELCCLFRKAELAMKEVEELERELSVPPLNQLRYVGQHLLKFLGGEDRQDKADLQKAKRHIQRAIYDSYEAGILGILEYIGDFQSVYGASPELREQIPEYDEFLDQSDAAHDLIDEAREGYDSREAFYEQCQPHLNTLRTIQRRLKRVEPVLKEAARRRKVKFWRCVVIGIVVAIIGVAGTLLGVLISSK